MGQRLNLELIFDTEEKFCVCANCYYHWGAYTISALETIEAAYKQYLELVEAGEFNPKEPLLMAYKIFHIPALTFTSNVIEQEDGKPPKTEFVSVMRSAGLCKSSENVMRFLYPGEKFDPATDRNVGLISISPDDVQSTRDAEEGRATLNFLDRTCSTSLFYPADEEEIMDMIDDNPNRIVDMPDDIAEYLFSDRIPMDKLRYIIDFLLNSNGYEFRVTNKEVVLDNMGYADKPMYVLIVA